MDKKHTDPRRKIEVDICQEFDYYSSPTFTSTTIKFSEEYINSPFEKLEEKIRKFANVISAQHDVEEVPSDLSIKSSLDILGIFKGQGVVPSKISLLNEGGIAFEFFVSSTYNAISIYNDGEITYLERGDNSNAIIEVLEFNKTKEKLSNAIKSNRERFFL